MGIMKIKYSPVHTDRQNTIIKYIDGNTIMIDGKTYEFDLESVAWEDIAEQTDYLILDAKRLNGELWITIRRYYTDIRRPDWDTGDYHDIKG
jgi:hypothetical protein